MNDFSPKAYDFNEQMKLGASGESAIDAYFVTAYIITPATRVQQSQGIDRVFEDKISGEIANVEYKTDLIAHKTGNAFIETVSVSRGTTNKPGWLYTTQADSIVYYIPKLSRAYIIAPKNLQDYIAARPGVFAIKKVLNKDWYTTGLLVPLLHIEQISEAIIEIK